MIPRGLAPPWKDVFVEGQLDVIHGGLLSKAVVQDAKLRQCSRYNSLLINALLNIIIVVDVGL